MLYFSKQVRMIMEGNCRMGILIGERRLIIVNVDKEKIVSDVKTSVGI